MNNMELSAHEAVEVRELISQEMLDIKKISASINMVNDNELKSFMQETLNSKKTALKDIQSTLTTQ
jgi:hypothetical protein